MICPSAVLHGEAFTMDLTPSRTSACGPAWRLTSAVLHGEAFTMDLTPSRTSACGPAWRLTSAVLHGEAFTMDLTPSRTSAGGPAWRLTSAVRHVEAFTMDLTPSRTSACGPTWRLTARGCAPDPPQARKNICGDQPRPFSRQRFVFHRSAWPSTLQGLRAQEFVGWLLNIRVYLRDGPAQTILRAATLRQKLQAKLSISPSHSILTPGQPVPALTL